MNEHKHIKIAIVNDHPIYRDGLTKLLALEEDLEVVAQASDGRQVVDLVREYSPDILLLDLKMPGMDGLTALRALRTAIPETNTKVIINTASDDKNEFSQAMKLGASGIVLVQTATELLIKSIRKVHAGETWLDSHTSAAVIRQFVANEEPAAPPIQHQPPSAPPRDRERSPLSQREREIVSMVAQGFKNKETAEKMFISEQTVKNHLHNIFDKVGLSDRLELALWAAAGYRTDVEPSLGREHERRSHRRFPMCQDVECRLHGGQSASATLTGKTISLSSGDVYLKTEGSITEATLLELLIDWPVLLNDSVPLCLYVAGRVLRDSKHGVAVSIERYSFRAKSRDRTT